MCLSFWLGRGVGFVVALSYGNLGDCFRQDAENIILEGERNLLAGLSLFKQLLDFVFDG